MNTKNYRLNNFEKKAIQNKLKDLEIKFWEKTSFVPVPYTVIEFYTKDLNYLGTKHSYKDKNHALNNNRRSVNNVIKTIDKICEVIIQECGSLEEFEYEE